MKPKNVWRSIVSIMILWSLAYFPAAFASQETLVLSVNPAVQGGTTTATIALENIEDIEGLSLELSFAAGTALSLPVSNWFTRNGYFPQSPFGAVPTVELNDRRAAATGKKIYISGFDPTGSSGQIGLVSFTVSPGAATGDAQVLSLSGKFYSKSGQVVKNLSPVSAIFTVGTLPNILALPTVKFFNPVIPGNQSTAQTVTVYNTGIANLVIYDLSITGTNSTEFIRTNDLCSGQTIAPGGSRTVGVIFAPLTDDLKTANLTIPSNDPDTPTLTVTLNMDGETQSTVEGDIDGDNLVTLTDAILALQIAVGVNPALAAIFDINGDGKLGIEEAIFLLQKTSGLR